MRNKFNEAISLIIKEEYNRCMEDIKLSKNKTTGKKD